MTPQAAAAHLERARKGIRQALAQWDATDLARVDESRELLVAAVAEMRIFESAVRAGDIPNSAELRDDILAARQEIAQATRVVDACVAFHRGLAVRTGGASAAYDSEGHLTGESGELEPEVHA